MRKSQFVGFLLTLLFGPLGLFYSSIAAALALLVAAFALALLTAWAAGLGAILVWPISILVGFATVANCNRRASLDERRHRELVKAANRRSRED